MRKLLVLSLLLLSLPVAAQVTGLNHTTYRGQASTPAAPGSGLYRVYVDNSGVLKIVNSSGTASSVGSPGGSTTQVQYNNAGAFAGSANFTYQTGASPNLLLTAANAAHVAAKFLGAASQSADTVQVLDSDETHGVGVSVVSDTPTIKAVGSSATIGVVIKSKSAASPGIVVQDDTGGQVQIVATGSRLGVGSAGNDVYLANGLWRVLSASGNFNSATANYQVTWNAAAGLKSAAAKVVTFTDASTGGGTFSAPATTPSQITSSQNNYNPGGSSHLIRLSSNAAISLTGLTFTAAQVDGQEHWLINTNASDAITLEHQDAASTAANRFIGIAGADVVLAADEKALVKYDSTTARWRVMVKMGFGEDWLLLLAFLLALGKLQHLRARRRVRFIR